MCIYIYITHTYTYTYHLYMCYVICIYAQICICICRYVLIHIYIYIYVYMCICIYIRISTDAHMESPGTSLWPGPRSGGSGAAGTPRWSSRPLVGGYGCGPEFPKMCVYMYIYIYRYRFIYVYQIHYIFVIYMCIRRVLENVYHGLWNEFPELQSTRCSLEASATLCFLL